jgi:hypothetical protein
MSVAHLDLLDAHVEEVAPRGISRRLVTVLGGIGMLALAAVPGAFAVLVLMRPDLFLSY